MTIKLTRLDLDYILTQIQMAEAGQVPVNPLLSFGLRQVNGINNNLYGSRSHLRLGVPAVPDTDHSADPERTVRHVLCLRPTAWSSTRSRARSACWSPARTPITRDHDAAEKSRRLVWTAFSAPRTTSS